MDCHFEADGEVVKVVLDGPLTASCADEFTTEMFARLRDRKRIIFDLRKMEHIDTSGLEALLKILQWVNQNGGAIKLVNLQSRPRIVFDITKAARVFDICDSEAAAAAAFGGNGP